MRVYNALSQNKLIPIPKRCIGATEVFQIPKGYKMEMHLAVKSQNNWVWEV